MDPLEERRDKYFTRLKDVCYLDHAGAGMYSDNQIDAVRKDLMCNVYGNPHSANFVSGVCRDNVDQVRNRILKHFNTTADEYTVIFTSGATAALKMVAENFDWVDSKTKISSDRSYLIYAKDNHTSVLGLTQLVKDKPVITKNLSQDEIVDIFQSDENIAENAEINSHTEIHDSLNSLFVYSAECNFSGIKYPLDWINKTRKGFLNKHCVSEEHQRNVKWYCLLDAATFLSTNELDLENFKPDFVCVSFYKIFGYPTGLGALIVRNSSSKVLKKKYFGGGTVKVALSDGSFHELRNALHERFEDGTINFLSILSLSHGYDAVQKIAGGMKNVTKTTFNITQNTFIRLLKLHHSNGKPAVELYIDTDYSSHHHQGAIINFNMLRDSGEYIGFMEVLNMANLHNIQLRTGCFCNPGACQRHLHLSNDQLIANFESGHVCGDSKDLLNGYPTGSVRVSFGYSSTQKDADKLLNLLIYCFVAKPVIEKIPDTWPERLRKLNRCISESNSWQSLENSRTEISKNCFQRNVEPESFSFVSAKDSTNWATNKEPESRPQLHVKKIFLYPVKSCGYFEIEDSWTIDKCGLQYDREWMIVNERGVALTQKHEPKLCFIHPKINLKTRNLELYYEDLDQACHVPLDLAEEKEDHDDSSDDIVSLCRSKVCGDKVTIRDCGDDVAAWLASVFERENVRLARVVSRKSKRDEELETLPQSLSNEGQYLLINEASITWCHELVKESEDITLENLIDRFRCNFLMSSTVEPLEELSWTQLQIGNVRFKVDGPCGRCQIICIDQHTGQKTKEPFTTLSRNMKGKVQFGIYLRLVEDSGVDKAVIRANDEITNIKS